MLKGQSVKVKDVGRIAGSASGLGLLLLAFLLVKPLVGSSASALEVSGDEVDSVETGEPVAQSDDGVAAQAEVLTSTVSFAFGEPVGVTTLTPVSESGASARYSVKATVGVENSGGYTVYLGSNKSELTGKNSGATINGVTSSSSYEDLPVNSWGYNATEGEAAGTSFSRMPENVRGVALGGNDASNIKSDSKTFMLSFAAHIGNDKPADTYENEVTLSVVSSPLEITNAFGIETMQEMTAAVCSNVEVGTTDQLRDVRDDKLYWVAKLPDNNCWMTQNLDLDIGAEWPDASLSDYDVVSTAYKPATTASVASAGTIGASYLGTLSWDFGDYVIASPQDASDCGVGKSGASACSSQLTPASSLTASGDANFYSKNGATIVGEKYDAHYLIGNYYQWNTATAGTGGGLTTGQASGSICPKGWRLPSGGANGDYAKMVVAGDIGSDVSKLTGAGYFFVRGGYIEQNVSTLFASAGNYGGYWTSNPISANNFSYYLYFGLDSNLYPANTTARYIGFSVRCVAR